MTFVPILASKLSIEDAVINSPYKIATLGWMVQIPDEDAYICRGKGDNWKLWYKVKLPNQDTTVFLDSSAFIPIPRLVFILPYSTFFEL